MRTVCITLDDDTAPRLHVSREQALTTSDRTRQHFIERGVDAQFFRGVHGSKIGLATTRPYVLNGTDEVIAAGVVGCWLSHRTLWAALLALTPTNEDLFFIVEDDVVFPENWKERFDAAVRDAGDFDLLFVGSCCTKDKPKTHVKGEVYSVAYPFCLHGLVVRRRALPVLIRTSDEAGCYAPIDVSLVLHTAIELKTYTVLPRILTQRDLILPE